MAATLAHYVIMPEQIPMHSKHCLEMLPTHTSYGIILPCLKLKNFDLPNNVLHALSVTRVNLE